MLPLFCYLCFFFQKKRSQTGHSRKRAASSSSKDLDKDECSRFIEERFSATKKAETRFKNVPILSELPPVPYLEKIIGVFSSIGGFDILTFIMIVHEYTGVLSKKNNTVHIHFLDSVSSKEKKLGAPKPTVHMQRACRLSAKLATQTIIDLLVMEFNS
ncbi:unnamed protein product [Caenorhabditis brenneri]